MKQAVLIIAHNNLELLRKNILLFNDPNIDIFVHIDKKSRIVKDDILRDLFKVEKQKSHIEFYKKIRVSWGGYSQIETELLLIEKCLKYSKKYGHIHLISGADLLIKTPKKLCNFFENNKDKEFVHFYSAKIRGRIEKRYKYYHFITESSWKRKKLYSILNNSMLIIQKLFRIDRRLDIEYQYGSQWFSITSNFAKYILSKKCQIKKMFKYTNCCDEIFLQTILVNSPFIKNVYKKDFSDNYESIMRLIDWNRGNPYTFRASDYNELVQSKMIFARKFDENIDEKIIDKVYNFLMEKKREKNK